MTLGSSAKLRMNQTCNQHWNGRQNVIVIALVNEIVELIFFTCTIIYPYMLLMTLYRHFCAHYFGRCTPFPILSSPIE